MPPVDKCGRPSGCWSSIQRGVTLRWSASRRLVTQGSGGRCSCSGSRFMGCAMRSDRRWGLKPCSPEGRRTAGFRLRPCARFWWPGCRPGAAVELLPRRSVKVRAGAGAQRRPPAYGSSSAGSMCGSFSRHAASACPGVGSSSLVAGPYSARASLKLEMSVNAWRKNHTVSAGLVRRFTGATPGGKQVTVHHRVKGE